MCSDYIILIEKDNSYDESYLLVKDAVNLYYTIYYGQCTILIRYEYPTCLGVAGGLLAAHH